MSKVLVHRLGMSFDGRIDRKVPKSSKVFTSFEQKETQVEKTMTLVWRFM